MKVSELQGAELDYWVAMAEGKDAEIRPTWSIRGQPTCIIFKGKREGDGHYPFFPSTDWSQGGPIIEKWGIQIAPSRLGNGWEILSWAASFRNRGALAHNREGPTPLIAAMRAFVASKYGDEVGDWRRSNG